jgi:hypothetical protein
VLSLSIALLGLAIAGLGLARLASPEAASLLAGAELRLGLGFVMLVFASFAVAMLLARPKAA